MVQLYNMLASIATEFEAADGMFVYQLQYNMPSCLWYMLRSLVLWSRPATKLRRTGFVEVDTAEWVSIFMLS